MKLCVFGAGAVGGVIAARLAAIGQPVSIIARGATLQALQRDGLGLVDHSGERTHHPITAVADPAELGPQDLVVIAVKQPSVASVAASIAPLLGPETRVMTAMNGVPWWFFDGLPGAPADTKLTSVDPDGDLRERIPTTNVTGCVVHFSADTPSPGVARLKMGNGLIIGDPTGEACTATREIAALLSTAGFDTTVSERIQRDIWFKLWGNMTMNPVSALTGATTDRILDDALVRQFCEGIMEEAAVVGARIGCPVDQTPAARNAVTLKLGAMKTSMLQDVEAGRALEIDALLGAVDEIATRTGVPAPSTGALLGLVRLFARVRGLYPQT